jgi:hypothetical protein
MAIKQLILAATWIEEAMEPQAFFQATCSKQAYASRSKGSHLPSCTVMHGKPLQCRHCMGSMESIEIQKADA